MEYFNYTLTHKRMKIELSNSPAFSEREIHSYHEILYCEDSSAILRTENGQTEIKGNRLFVIPSGKYHLFDLSGGKQFTRLKISIPDEMLYGVPLELFSGEIAILRHTESGVDFLIKKLCELVKSEENATRGHHAYFAVMMLLSELNSFSKSGAVASGRDNDLVVARAVEYITDNLSGDLSINQISRALSFSESLLSHKFRENMGISLHGYILEKRMSHAHQRICAGERPTKIYRECGYGDYSSFYKAYLRYFSFPPSERESILPDN